MAVFSDIIQQNHVLDAGQLFSSSHDLEWPSLFSQKKFKGWKVIISTKSDLQTFIYSKNEIKEGHSKRSKVDKFNLHRNRSFIDQYTENSPPIRRITKI